MKRNHGIWFLIVGILVLGIFSTSMTKRFVNKQAFQSLETYTDSVQDSEMARMVEPSPDTALMADPAGGAVMPNVQAEEGTTLAITPLGEPALEAETAAGIIGEESERYRQRLEDLDEQAAQNRKNNPDNTTNAMKVNAEYELRLCEGDIDAIMEQLSIKLKDTTYEVILGEQRVWQRTRESLAIEVSRRYSGSALESVEYTASLAEQARSRVYELVEEYGQELEAE